MASGKEHSASSLGMAFGYGTGYLSGYLLFPNQAMLVPLGIVLSIMLTSDHDVDAGNKTHDYVRKRFGFVGEMIWKHWWLPYAKAIKHRDFLSHFPVVSSGLRLVYLIFPPIIILFGSGSFAEIFVRSIIAQAISIPLNAVLLVLWYYRIDITFFFYPLFFGICLGDLLHYLFDHL